VPADYRIELDAIHLRDIERAIQQIKPYGPCPCGSGKILAQCCRRFNGLVLKGPAEELKANFPASWENTGNFIDFGL
jgi:hypothetical protein